MKSLKGMAVVAAMLAMGLATAGLAEQKRIEPVLLEDGMLSQSWFLNSFLDLRDDIAESTAQKKRLAIMWEQRGCPYCLETHRVNFADPAINDYVRERFNIIQLDIHGARQVTDIDGASLSERDLARKYGVTYTPTFTFFPEAAEKAAGKQGRAAEVARMAGYFKPVHFLAMFQYVHESAYERQPFQRYLKEKTERAPAGGRKDG